MVTSATSSLPRNCVPLLFDAPVATPGAQPDRDESLEEIRSAGIRRQFYSLRSLSARGLRLQWRGILMRMRALYVYDVIPS